MKFLEARDICNILHISLGNVYSLMKRPDFPAVQVSARRYVVPEDLFEKWLVDQVELKKTTLSTAKTWKAEADSDGNVSYKAYNNCQQCGKEFYTDFPNAKYCPECRKQIRAQQNRDRVRRYREKVSI